MTYMGFFIGNILGALLAYSKKGTWLDMLQYAVVLGIIFALIGLIASITFLRMG